MEYLGEGGVRIKVRLRGEVKKSWRGRYHEFVRYAYSSSAYGEYDVLLPRYYCLPVEGLYSV